MKRLLLFFLIIFLGWDALWALMGVTPLFPWQLQEKMKQDPPDLALLDVRTSWEFHWFHLPGAHHLPFERGLPNDLRIPKTSPVVIICLTGHRSPVVAYRLQQAGFTEVYSLTWGMAGWEVWKWIAVKLSGERQVQGERNETGWRYFEGWFSLEYCHRARSKSRIEILQLSASSRQNLVYSHQ